MKPANDTTIIRRAAGRLTPKPCQIIDLADVLSRTLKIYEKPGIPRATVTRRKGGK